MKTKLIILAAALLSTFSLGAQQTLRFENVRDRNLWLGGNNATGMRDDSLSIARAELQGSYTTGENRRSWEAPRTWDAGAQASAIRHLGNFSLAGSFSFLQTTGYDMCGSMFINPGRYPIDIMEYTPGTKSRQRYSFDGAVSVDLGSSWRIGAKVDFTSTNCSKRKDLRYTDYALDFSIKPGIQWHSGNTALGLSLIFERNTETISAEQIAPSESAYYAFIDKGLHYGLRSIWDNSGIHLSEEGVKGFPTKEMAYGAALQFSSGCFYLEGGFKYRKGEIGEKDAIWFRYPSREVFGTLAWKLHSSRGGEHILRIDGRYTFAGLNESVMEKTTQSGVTTRTIYSWNSIRRSGELSVSPSWSAIREGVYEFYLGADYSRSDVTLSAQYPYIGAQTLRKFEISSEARILVSRWALIARLSFGNGFLGVDELRKSTETVSEPEPYRETEYYGSWLEYETSPHILTGCGARCTLDMGLYFELATDFMVRSEKNRIMPILKIGYTF